MPAPPTPSYGGSSPTVFAVPFHALEQQLSLLARRLTRPVQLDGPAPETVLERPAYQCLRQVVDHGPLRPTALAVLLEVDLSVASRQLKALEDVGLVGRCPDPADARATLVSATAAGVEAFQATQRRRAEVVEEVVRDWPEEDRDELVRLLTRFNLELERAVTRRGLAPS